MISVQFDLTTRCSQRCYMCRQYTWNHREIDFDLLKEKINKFYEENPNCTFTFSGGDPLSYSKLSKLNELLKEKKDLKYQVFTNLDYDLSQNHIREFLERAEFVQVSMDGSTPEMYASIRYSGLEKNYVSRYKRLIENIRSLKTKVKLNMTVSVKNYTDVFNVFMKFCKFDNVVGIRFFPVHTNEDVFLQKEMFNSIKSQMLHIAEVSSTLKARGEKVADTNIKSFEFEKRKPFAGKCYVKAVHRVVDQNGTEYPCCRATNDNGCDWEGKFRVENLDGIDDENKLYSFCKNCDRYVKFNSDFENVKKSERRYL